MSTGRARESGHRAKPWVESAVRSLLGGSGAERSEAGALGTTKEVLGFIVDFDFNSDFLGFPIILNYLFGNH